MVERTITSQDEWQRFIKYMEGQKLPVTLTIRKGKHRSVGQNRLQRLWMNEISAALRDQTPEEVRGFCKLTIGVPILREDEIFREKYDRILKPLTYEQKIELMMEPMDFPVTRLMTTEQNARYLDAVVRYWAEKGIALTLPEGA